MPNMPSLEKEKLNFRIDRDIAARARIKAAREGETLTDVVTRALVAYVAGGHRKARGR